MPYKDPNKAREFDRLRSRRRRRENLAAFREYDREWKRKYRQDQPEKTKQDWDNWRRKNPNKIREYAARAEAKRHGGDGVKTVKRSLSKAARVARSKGAVGFCTVEQWMGRIALYGNQCAYCGRSGVKLTIDHVIPLVAGGTNWPANLVPACRSCNPAKGMRRWNPKLPATRYSE